MGEAAVHPTINAPDDGCQELYLDCHPPPVCEHDHQFLLIGIVATLIDCTTILRTLTTFI